jgi:hypothetical protein
MGILFCSLVWRYSLEFFCLLPPPTLSVDLSLDCTPLLPTSWDFPAESVDVTRTNIWFVSFGCNVSSLRFILLFCIFRYFMTQSCYCEKINFLWG